MPQHFTAPKFGAIAAGLLCFIVIFYGLFNWALGARLAPSVVTVLLWGIVVVPGFVVGAIVQTSPIMNSLILGILIVLIVNIPSFVLVPPTSSSVIRGIGPRALALAPLAVTGVVLCCVGGVLGAAVRREIRGS